MRSAKRRAASRSSDCSSAARLGQLGGVEQRLGEQLQRADRGLQLVADVGDEVPPDPGQPVRLGDVGGLDRDVGGVQRDRAQVQAERGLRAAGAAARQVQLDLAADAGAADLAGERTQDRVRGDGAGCAAGAQQPHRPGGRVDQHGLVVGVEHDDADAQRVEALAAEALEPVLAGRLLVVRVDGASPLGRSARQAGVVGRRSGGRCDGAGRRSPATTPTARATRPRPTPNTQSTVRS